MDTNSLCVFGRPLDTADMRRGTGGNRGKFFHKAYHVLECSRQSYTMNPYHRSLGKNHVAYNECLELMNWYFQQFSMVCDQEAFAKQGFYIGISKMSKLFIHHMHGLETETTQVVFKSAKKPKCLPEWKLLYEMHTLLRTHVYVPGRKFDRMHAGRVIPKLKTKLKDAKIENKIKGKVSNSAYKLLSSISHIMDNNDLA